MSVNIELFVFGTVNVVKAAAEIQLAICLLKCFLLLPICPIHAHKTHSK